MWGEQRCQDGRGRKAAPRGWCWERDLLERLCHSQKDENVSDRAGEVRACTGNRGRAGLGNVLRAELKEFGVILKLLTSGI